MVEVAKASVPGLDICLLDQDAESESESDRRGIGSDRRVIKSDRRGIESTSTLLAFCSCAEGCEYVSIYQY